MAFLQKRYNDIWYLIDKSGGKPKWIKLGKISKAEAKTVKSRYEIDQTYLKLDIQSDSRITFSECSTEYLEWAKTHKASNTIRTERLIFQVLSRTLGNRRLAAIASEDYELFWKRLKPNSIRLRIAAIRALYKFAILRKYVRKNVGLDLKRPSIPLLPPRHVDPKLIEKALSIMQPRTRAKFEILYYTGMRPSEVLRLKTNDIDIDNRKITVRYSKTNRFRVIPMHSKLVPVFKEIFASKNGNEYLFPGLTHDHQVSMRDGLRKACERADIENLTPYCFRHTFATTVLEKTKDIRAVQQLLGHSTIQMTTRYATALDYRFR